MVSTTLATEERVKSRPITLQEIGEMTGVPIVVRSWWGSLRRRWAGKLRWECPAQGGAQKTRPEIRDGKIWLWEGKCGYPGHTHAQTIKVLDIRPRAMLIVIHLGGAADAHFLLSMDGNFPFFVQVIRRNKTVKEAFDWLVPKLVKEAIEQGLDVKRQGDWFFIPTDKKLKECQSSNKNFVSAFVRDLRLNTFYRNAPLVYSYRATRHHGELVIYKSLLGAPHAVPFVKGKVTAPDHDTLILPGWHIAMRNRSHPWRNTDGKRVRFDD